VTDASRAVEAQDEPDLLRDQFRQLLRYRGLIALGILIGLIGGAYLAISGSDSYVATAEVVLRNPTTDPFDSSSGSADNQINMGSERQTAMSSSIALNAAKLLHLPKAQAAALESGLQVTNPPNTLVLRFAYTADTPKTASTRANAFTRAYMDAREAQTKATIKHNVAGYQKQLTPVNKQRKQIDAQIARAGTGDALTAATTAEATLVSRISELSSKITELEALDTTPGTWIRVATPPAAPSGPALPMMLVLGAVVGVAVGLLGAWVRLVFDPTARSESDVVRALRAPVLGTLPRTKPGGPLLAVDNSDPRLAEEYRSTAFRLAYDQRFADRRRLLVVAPRTTHENDDASSAVAVNLAASFAEMGMDVLLIEADLRTPALSARLRAADGTRPGWARNSGVGDGGWPSGLQVPVDAGESGSFDLVPGRRVRNVARALTSAPASRLISEADTPGSAVIVLAPPVLSYADALALADRVDGVLVVADPHAVHRADLDRVRELVDGAGGTVLGAVLHGNGRPSGLLARFRLGRKRKGVRRAPARPALPEPPALTSGPSSASTSAPGSAAGRESGSLTDDKHSGAGVTDTVPLRTLSR
jgi:Mrp family chromosome partitioning ATPase/uncharacterized protein involved in exopolysaccharide biosynthesis